MVAINVYFLMKRKEDARFMMSGQPNAGLFLFGSILKQI